MERETPSLRGLLQQLTPLPGHPDPFHVDSLLGQSAEESWDLSSVMDV